MWSKKCTLCKNMIHFFLSVFNYVLFLLNHQSIKLKMVALNPKGTKEIDRGRREIVSFCVFFFCFAGVRGEKIIKFKLKSHHIKNCLFL